VTGSQERKPSESHQILEDNENDWPFIYAILAELGCADGLGGAEHRRRTLEMLAERLG